MSNRAKHVLAVAMMLIFTSTIGFGSSVRDESPATDSGHADKEKKISSDKKESHSKDSDKKTVKKPKAAKPKETAAAHAGGHSSSSMTPEDAMKQLLEGNKRHMSYKYANPNRSQQCRLQNAKGQHPNAVILGCSDSRVPPEIIFDQGVGDLFVVRTAGHVVDSTALGSIEYAVEHLGAKLIVVLGHERCGAVDATLKGGEAPGNLKSIVDSIKPAVEKAKLKPNHSHDCDTLCSSVKMNVKQQIENIKKNSPILAEFIQDGVLKVVGAYYDLNSGEVKLTYIPSLI